MFLGEGRRRAAGRGLLLAALLVVQGFLSPIAEAGAEAGKQPAARILFEESFDGGLERWEVLGRGSAKIVDSGDPAHGRVLALVPVGDAYALIRGSDRWTGVRLEGDVFFPSDDDNYLGVVYSFHRRHRRMDFGVVYIKGNGSYLQANPHRDFNVGRTLYPEYHVPLTGDAAIRIGRWQKFAVEIVGRTCHFYVGESATPQMTFAHFELESGAVGLQPRSVGGDVWVDDLKATAIDRFSYGGPPVPAPAYDPDELATRWEVIGPLTRTEDEIAETPAAPGRAWKSLETDDRGAVVTARVVDFHGPETVAYFRTRVSRPTPGPATLEFSTVDDLAIWVNGHFEGFYSRGRAAWFDFFRTPSHAGRSIPLELVAGENQIVVRVRGGVYASGGFFARVVGPES